jgi:hypothetical protein
MPTPLFVEGTHQNGWLHACCWVLPSVGDHLDFRDHRFEVTRLDPDGRVHLVSLQDPERVGWVAFKAGAWLEVDAGLGETTSGHRADLAQEGAPFVWRVV